jgi:hypothetical protein
MYGQFLKIYGRFPKSEQLLATRDTKLRAASLSAKKIEHLKDLSARVSDGWLKLDLLPLIADEGVMEHLVQVKGIGRWTAEMFLIFCFALAGRTPCPSATWDYARPSKRRIFSFRAPVAGSHPQYCQGVEAPLQRRHMVSVEVARAVQGNRIG